jgi:hypothetical protein
MPLIVTSNTIAECPRTDCNVLGGRKENITVTHMKEGDLLTKIRSVALVKADVDVCRSLTGSLVRLYSLNIFVR